MRPAKQARLLTCAAVVLSLTAAGCSSLRTHDEPGVIVVYDAGPSGGPDGGIRQNKPVMKGEILQ